MNEQGGAPNAGAPKEEPQVIDQEVMKVVVEMMPHPGNIQADAYAQLLDTVEGLFGTVRVSRGPHQEVKGGSVKPN